MGYSSDQLISKILDLYYNEALSQDAIAGKLNISRATVARNLAKARELGYVKITIHCPNEEVLSLERTLSQKYGMQEVIIAGTEQSPDNIYHRAAGYLSQTLHKDHIFGITWGTSVKRVVDCLSQTVTTRARDLSCVKVVPLIGSTNVINSNNPEHRLTSSNFLANRCGEVFNAVSYNLPAPMFVSGPEVKKLLEKEKPIAEVMNLARNSHMVLLGIGTVDENSTMGKTGSYSPEEYRQFREKGAVGEILGRMYDSRGISLNSEYNDRILGISLEELQKIPVRIAVAFGEEKIEAIRSALRGKIINVLITDQETAAQL